MKFIFIKNKKGYTLVETLVAIAVLLLGMTGAFSAIQGGLISTVGVKDRIVAFFLAQESMEAIKNKKDQNLLIRSSEQPNPTQDWLEGIVPLCPSDGSAMCDYNNMEDPNIENDEFYRCDSQNDQCKLFINPDGLYVWAFTQGTTESKFRRQIKLIETLADKEARVTVEVTWSQGGFNHSFEVTENIYSWY